MKRLEVLDNKALASSVLYYDKEEIENFLNLFDKVKIIDNELSNFVSIIRTIYGKGKFDDLPKISVKRKETIIRLIEAEISRITESIKREKLEEWFSLTKEYECDLELSEELIYRYCWAEYVDRIITADKEDIPFRDKLTIHPEIPDLSSKKIKPMSDIIIQEEYGKVFSSGVPGLDDIVKMRTSNFVCVGARTTVGKSLFMLNQAIHNASKGIKLLYTSLEESEEELKLRVERHMHNKSEDEIKKVLSNILLFCPDTSNPDSILTEAEKCIKEEGIELIFIDYIQLMKYPNMNDWDSMRTLTRHLKLYAIRNNVLLITASQLKREAEMLGSNNTTLYGSSTLEADANCIILLETVRKQNVRVDNKNAVQLNVTKNRGGEQGVIETVFDYSCGHIN